MQIIGLTGGIASGKSTVAQMFVELGVEVVSADALYHQLIAPKAGREPSKLTKEIVRAFPGVLQNSGHINRKQLGPIVFANTQALKKLGAITHPAVAAAFQARCAQAAQKGTALLIYDVPLLFERNLDRTIPNLHGVLVVWVPQATQLERMLSRDGITKEAAEQRLKSQLCIDEKRQRATWVIDNSGTLASCRTQVKKFWREFQSFS